MPDCCAHPPHFRYSSFLDYPNLVAVLSSWRPGEEGGTAIVNLLLGAMVTGGPSGRLPQAWPRSAGQVGGPASPWFQQRNGKWIANKKGPIDPVDHLYHYDPYVDADSAPEFAFGFGLSFTGFEYGAITAEPAAGAGTVAVKLSLKNVGAVGGAEVVLLFVTAPLDNVVRYWKRLVGFQKVWVPAGASTTVTITLQTDDLAVYGTATPGAPAAGTRRVIPGQYRLSAGGSADSDLAITTFTLP